MDPAIKQQIEEIDEEIMQLRQEITDKKFKIAELENARQALTRQLSIEERINQLFS